MQTLIFKGRISWIAEMAYQLLGSARSPFKFYYYAESNLMADSEIDSLIARLKGRQRQ